MQDPAGNSLSLCKINGFRVSCLDEGAVCDDFSGGRNVFRRHAGRRQSLANGQFILFESCRTALPPPFVWAAPSVSVEPVAGTDGRTVNFRKKQLTYGKYL